MSKPSLDSKKAIAYECASETCFQVGMHDMALKMMEDIYAFKYADLKKHRSLNYIERVNFEISSVCNLKCKYCTFLSGKRKKFIDPALFEKVVLELAEKVPGLGRLALYMSGESLMHPQFVMLLEIVARIKKTYPSFQPVTYLHTNGMLWTPDMNDRIMKTGALNRVVWSIDGINADSFEQMRMGAKFSRVLDNYEYFLNHKPEKVEAWINNLVEKPAEPVDYDQRMRGLFARADCVSTFMPKPLNESKKGVPCQWIGSPAGFCEYVFHTVVVTTSGRMSLCCIDYNSLNAFGDLTANTFIDTYFSKERFDILEKMALGKRAEIKGCTNCKVVKNAWSTDTARRTTRLPFGYSWREHVRGKWRKWAEDRKISRVAIFGAGQHTLALDNALRGQSGPQVVAVLDEKFNPDAFYFELRPRKAKDFELVGVDAIVLSSDTMQDRLAWRCRELYGNNALLLNFYDGLPMGPYDKTK